MNRLKNKIYHWYKGFERVEVIVIEKTIERNGGIIKYNIDNTIFECCKQSVQVRTKNGYILSNCRLSMIKKIGGIYVDRSRIFILDMENILVFNYHFKLLYSIPVRPYTPLLVATTTSKGLVVALVGDKKRILLFDNSGKPSGEFPLETKNKQPIYQIRGMMINSLDQIIVYDSMHSRIHYFDLDGTNLFSFSS